MSENAKLAAIGAILKELGIELSTSDMDARIKMQKAIYLAQVGGADLGYRFSWYVRGPYCSALADDYYKALALPDIHVYVANADLKGRLAKAKALIDAKPPNAEDVDWLEATASLDYMKRIQKKNGDLEEAFRIEKPHLAGLYASALASLQAFEK